VQQKQKNKITKNHLAWHASIGQVKHEKIKIGLRVKYNNKV